MYGMLSVIPQPPPLCLDEDCLIIIILLFLSHSSAPSIETSFQQPACRAFHDDASATQPPSILCTH